MSEERIRGFRTEDAGGGAKKILSIGRDPWLVRKLQGIVKLRRGDAARLRVTALDANGQRAGDAGTGAEILLLPDRIYYLVLPVTE